MVTLSEELGPWDWMAKINERLTFIRMAVIDHKDISELDYELLRIFYKVWYNGELPLYATKMDGDDDVAVQQPLFPDNLSLFNNGINIENTLS